MSTISPMVTAALVPSPEEGTAVDAQCMQEDKRMAEADSTGMDEAEELMSSRREKYLKISLIVLLVGVIIFVILDYTLPSGGFVSDTLKDFLSWVEDNPGEGVVAFASVYVVTTVLFIPGSLLTLGAGLVFGRAMGTGLGVLLGSVAVLALIQKHAAYCNSQSAPSALLSHAVLLFVLGQIGATIGACCAFLLGRYVLQKQAQGLFNKFKIMRAVNSAVETQGLKLVILLRLSPVVPFSAFNYVMGLTKVSFKDYALACVGFIPGTVAYVFIGTSASGLLGDDEEEEDDDGGGSGTVQLIVIIVGVIATIIAVVLISIYSKRALRKALEAEEQAGEEGEGGATNVVADEGDMEAGGLVTVDAEEKQLGSNGQAENYGTA